MPEWLFRELENNKAVKMLDQGKKEIPYTSLIQEALIIAVSYLKRPRPILVIKNNLYQAQNLYERISAFLDESSCALFGADESLRVAAIAASPELTALKTETLSSLINHPEQVVITSPSALLRHLPLPEQFKAGCIRLKTGDEADMSAIRSALLSGGYQQAAHIDHPLTFASRGGIIDVYSINYAEPVRIEFFDTEIESIRFFDPATQKTVRTTEEVEIVPASDVIFTDDQISEIITKTKGLYKDGMIPSEIESDLNAMENHIFDHKMYSYMALLSETAGIWDYMNFPMIIYSDEKLISESAKNLNQETVSYIQEMVQEGKMIPKFAVWHEYERIAPGCRKIEENPFSELETGIEEIHLPGDTLDFRLKIIRNDGRAVLSVTDKELLRIKTACAEMKIPVKILNQEDEPAEGINLFKKNITQGFHIVSSGIKVYTSSELFEIRHHKGRYENKFRNAEVIDHYDDLNAGDYVVHSQYGVGQFIGIETREIQSVKRDFLKVVYRGNAELLVPLEQFRLVRKFVSREGVVPRLNKLGTNEWEKTKKRLEENVNDIAERLINLYSSREQHIGFAYSPDNEMTVEFENAFPFELTPDQEKAVKDIKKDMESDRPMDRLVCGDVGFGKTEVAVRASFKAVSDNKQTAVLCPTTILAEQHYRTFSKRFSEFPVTVRVLDRFVPANEQKQIIRDLKNGKVDILIGTHRILSKDIVFKDLGLLVIDEEQRFGVEHKEKIKELKNGIDVLALSATPIPRTLQMSLIGIRSLSQLETPPLNRYSVQTYVVEKNNNLVADAIQKELARNGQVFYLYNNIERIYNTARTLRHMLPSARIGIVHGQMDRNDIEDVMLKFTSHELDVLVCTTIVENGIDIPNVNTILIDNAQDFGLSQIYQIKGRVGRSDRIAYAYLLVPPNRQLSEVAQKRLQAVKEFARLGSGYKIAMRDLTIRGAGNLLGSNQSGFIDTVGIDMYIEMLENAIQKKKTGSELHKEPEKRANIRKSSFIPENFAANDYDKLDMYQRIDTIETVKELKEYKDDVIDQYGRLPKEVSTLFEKRHLDILLNDPAVHSYRETNDHSEVTFSTLFSSSVDGVRLFESFTKISRDITIKYTNGTIIAMIPKSKNYVLETAEVIEKAKESVRK